MSDERAEGFTLLEVIVALAIAALALIVLFRAGSDGLLAVDTATQAEEAIERAQSHLAAIGHDVALLQGESAGDDGGGYHWRLRITPVASWPAQLANRSSAVTATTLFDVQVAISWSGRGHDHAIVLDTRRIGSAAATR
jgi:general secretion pathway protein I